MSAGWTASPSQSGGYLRSGGVAQRTHQVHTLLSRKRVSSAQNYTQRMLPGFNAAIEQILPVPDTSSRACCNLHQGAIPWAAAEMLSPELLLLLLLHGASPSASSWSSAGDQ